MKSDRAFKAREENNTCAKYSLKVVEIA